MSKPRNISPVTKMVVNRFFEAVDALIARGDLRGIQTYCDLYEIDKRNFYKQRSDEDRGIFQVSWMVPLVTEYKVSAAWLLTGKGTMFKNAKI